MTSPIPPRPATPPTVGQHSGPKNVRNINKTKNGGGFNPSITPTLNVTVPSAGKNGSAPAGAAGARSGGSGGATIPGADFMSNDDIRAFCEYLRKDARNRATERAMDADHLEAVLRTIPDVGGSLSGSRARARRVSRWLKKVAAAEKAIQKYSASIYATFEREYDAQLRQIGRGRIQQRNHRAPFNWQS